MEVKCKSCPECGCKDFVHEDIVGEGYRMCIKCEQEWWVDIDYISPKCDEVG